MPGEIVAVLKAAFRKKKKSQRNFTLNYMSKKVGLSTSFLSQILNGHRLLPLEYAEQICNVLDLDDSHRELVLRRLLAGRKIKVQPSTIQHIGDESSKRTIAWTFQPSSSFWLLEDPWLLPIANATLLNGFDGTVEDISRVLNLSLEQVEKAVTLMLESGYLIKERGRIKKAQSFNDFHSNTEKSSIRKFHCAALDRTKEILNLRVEPEDINQRMVTTNVVAIPSDKVPWLRQRIKEMVEQITADATLDGGDQLYQLAVSFVPLSDSTKQSKLTRR